ncbi:MAG: T9SS type A sorting domain-containing protein [Candidatus Delongbacteria bacterium]|jgi:hypothetical protein|nr:T9SS type A sorting domain-containing protein [Candidatus Delongbacteria bacterium]
MLSKLKILLFILFLQLIVFSQFAGGTGTEEDPWLIRTASNLDSIRYYIGEEHADQYFLQIENIDLGVAPWNNGTGWKPIGDDTLPFMGNYEVEIDRQWNGYDYYSEILHLVINDTLLNNAGLFGVIQNASIVNVQVILGEILGKNSCGSLAGSSKNSKIINCSAASCKITGLDNNIGGLIGFSVGDSVSVGCSDIWWGLPAGEVSGIGNVGGLIGNCKSSISNCYSTSDIEGNNSVGGFIGLVNNSSILNCHSVGNVTGDYFIGGLVGAGDSTSVIHSYWSINTSGQSESAYGEGRIDMSNYNDSTFVDWDFDDIWNLSYENHGPSPFPRFYRNIYVGISNEQLLVNNLELEQNYPNPFNPTTKISYILPNGYFNNVKLEIFNIKGELVKLLVNQKQNTGKYSVEFNAANLNSGIYFYSLKTANTITSKKMILLK